MQSSFPATFYIVPTPIGHYGDITLRALKILTQTSIILCEDTRTSKQLLSHHQIPLESKKLISCHEHNEKNRIIQIQTWLNEGLDIALISDAGTPLISDPGFPIIQHLKTQNHSVVPLPGACALICALSGSGIAPQPFQFLGFLSNKKITRFEQLSQLHQNYKGTSILYEACHRIISTLKDIETIWGTQHTITLAKELTKQHETLLTDNTSNIITWLETDILRQKGEFILIISPLSIHKNNANLELEPMHIKLLETLLPSMSPSDAAKLTAQYFNIPKKPLYNYALQNKNTES